MLCSACHCFSLRSQQGAARGEGPALLKGRHCKNCSSQVSSVGQEKAVAQGWQRASGVGGWEDTSSCCSWVKHHELWGWRSGSVVKSPFCFCRGPELSSHNPHGGPHHPLTALPEQPTLSLASTSTRHACGTHTDMLQAE